MTQTIIKDGKGSGKSAEVDNTNRLHTRGIVTNLYQQALVDGKAFFISSGIQTLTSGTVSHLLYVKNNDDRDLLVDLSIVNMGVTTGGSGDFTFTITLNPTAGTLIASGAAGVAANVNLGSALTADLTITTGSEGSTLTDGVPIPNVLSHPGRETVKDTVVIPKGSSLAMGATPPSGNSSMAVQFGLQVLFLEDI
jgi:hypothetical protein